MHKSSILGIFGFFLFFQAFAQAPQKLTSSEIYHKIEKLNFLGSVLYVGAHPDDENTSLISYFSNKVNARTAYLSLTRGDGGQNLVGPEIREQLGVIRTQELLAARKIDGGEQFFTRANDFGYSKNPKETLNIWDEEKVLADVVWRLRKFRPDVVINRFDYRTPGTTHGHHTASAMLSVKAFNLAADKNAYPQQLQYTQTYQPQRLFFNTSPWFYPSKEAFDNADKSKFVEFNTGSYFPLRGLSNPEISSLSRSQHKSQGFGSMGSRGSQKEYLELIKGNMPPGKKDVFAGIDTSWKRVQGGAKIGQILEEVLKTYNFEQPAQSIPQLLQAYTAMQNLKENYWKNIKLPEIREIIAACAGIYAEAITESPFASPSDTISVNLEIINRSATHVQLEAISLLPSEEKLRVDLSLENNADWSKNMQFQLADTANYTSPYWLNKNASVGMYAVEKQEFIGLPETPRYLKAVFQLTINGVSIPLERHLVYKFNDNVKGESYQNFEIIPPVSVGFNEEVKIFKENTPQNISVEISSTKKNLNGKLEIKGFENWQISPVSQPFSINQKGASKILNFSVIPPEGQASISLKPVVVSNGKKYSDKITSINYDYIPKQTLVLPSALKLVKIDIKKKGELVGYIPGAGDVVSKSIQQIGYDVKTINAEAISTSALKNLDAVVMGIRAYNVDDALKYKQHILMEYVKNGGTLIVQYNKNNDLVTNKLAPYPLKLSRDRVTEENTEVGFLAPEHPVLNTPNKITHKDFEGWVQERGLYFPSEWAKEFTPILSMHDKNESAKNSSLLVARYGKGYYVYTGISFFRQFPAGVPGAFRLFANLISIGN